MKKILSAILLTCSILFAMPQANAQQVECATTGIDLMTSLSAAKIVPTVSSDKESVFKAVRAALEAGVRTSFPLDLDFDFFIKFLNPSNPGTQTVIAPVKDGCVLGYLSLDHRFFSN